MKPGKKSYHQQLNMDTCNLQPISSRHDLPKLNDKAARCWRHSAKLGRCGDHCPGRNTSSGESGGTLSGSYCFMFANEFDSLI